MAWTQLSLGPFIGLISIAVSATLLVLTLIYARHHGRTVVIVGSALILAGFLVSRILAFPGIFDLLYDSLGAHGLGIVDVTVAVVANLLKSAGILALAVGVVRGRGLPEQLSPPGLHQPDPHPGPPPGAATSDVEDRGRR